MTRVIIHGYQGKMGQILCQMAEEMDCIVVAAVDRSPAQQAMPFPAFTHISDCDMPADVIIDFSVSAAVPALMEYAIATKTPVVLCTTGLGAEELDTVQKASEQVAVFKSANMSMGLNYLLKTVREAAKNLHGAGFDIEIVEKHHNRKVDAPSGTAFMLAEAINEALDNQMEYVHDRSKTREKRKPQEIGMHAVRGGTIVGEHSVIFAGGSEVLEFKHTAQAREVFAVGAFKAAVYLSGKEKGMYNMDDILC